MNEQRLDKIWKQAEELVDRAPTLTERREISNVLRELCMEVQTLKATIELLKTELDRRTKR